MLLLDVNILVYAHRADAPEHPAIQQFLAELLKSGRPFGIPAPALSGLVRVATLSHLQPPSTLDEVFGFCQALMSAANCLIVEPSDDHWELFELACRASNANGKLVPDAYLAAFALARDDEFITVDRDFRKFPGLRWRHPLADHVTINPR